MLLEENSEMCASSPNSRLTETMGRGADQFLDKQLIQKTSIKRRGKIVKTLLLRSNNTYMYILYFL